MNAPARTAAPARGDSTPPVARLAHTIAYDAACVIEHLDRLIEEGESGSRTSCELESLRTAIARIGWLADVVSTACGGDPYGGGPADWFLTGYTRGALNALQLLEGASAQPQRPAAPAAATGGAR